jgi:hypothetical protein
MPLITDASNTWSAPVTLGSDEIWQARQDGVFLTTATSPSPQDGLLLREGAAVQISAGRSVRYRLAGRQAALIAREAV